MVSFTISFDKHSRQYIAGETVHCRVQITVHKGFKARSLTLRWVGKAKTKWSRGKNNDFFAREEYFRLHECLQGVEHGEVDDVLPGNYEFHCSFTLPSDLPSSFEHRYGYIRYSVTANYDIPNWFDKYEEELFLVTAQLNLNYFPELAMSFKYMEEKIFGCLCCKTGPMQLTLNLPKQGYIPGELIPITVEVDNNSKVAIKAVQVKLREKLTFIATEPRKETRYKISTIKKHTFDVTVAPFQNKFFEISFLVDPAYDWKLFYKSGIILCDYIVEVKAKTNGCHRNTSFETKVVIGTVNANVLSQAVPTNGQVDPCTTLGWNDSVAIDVNANETQKSLKTEPTAQALANDI